MQFVSASVEIKALGRTLIRWDISILSNCFLSEMGNYLLEALNRIRKNDFLFSMKRYMKLTDAENIYSCSVFTQTIPEPVLDQTRPNS